MLHDIGDAVEADRVGVYFFWTGTRGDVVEILHMEDQ